MEDVEVHIDDKDIRIDVMRASGNGGQFISPSYEVQITQTRTLFQPEFRDEHNGATRFPQFSRLRLVIL